ncbi:MAG: nucleotidyltransferase domain-containing protein [Phycisphaerae bacterium]|nr:nucleotidyltransferase domain-containing protein [Phycisphaerae bacterium]
MTSRLPPLLPLGTAVVALVELRGGDGRVVHAPGATGTIVKSPADPEHSYRIRFPGGDEASLKRRDIQVLKHYQSEGYDRKYDPLTEFNLYDCVIFRAVIGSRAYGLEHGESDTDVRGIYLPPAAMHWSIYGVPEQLENNETQECYWEYEKFLKLALKANPNVLEVLYSPIVLETSPIAERVRESRAMFLSKLVYQTFNGYAMSQFRKLEQDVRSSGSVKWKHAMHLIRLLLSGIEALRTGDLPLRVETHRDLLLDIRDGRMEWDAVDHWRSQLHSEFEATFALTSLPDRPDYDKANVMLIEARQEMVKPRNCEGRTL